MHRKAELEIADFQPGRFVRSSLVQCVTNGQRANLMAMTTLCPAGCYTLTEAGQVEVAPDGCFECGTCRVMCEPSGEVEWNYPRGGYGVLFKFG